jgi:hypothetical protein
MGAAFGEIGAWVIFGTIIGLVAIGVLWYPVKFAFIACSATWRAVADSAALAEFDALLREQPDKARAYFAEVRANARRPAERDRVEKLVRHYERRYSMQYQQYHELGIL